MSRRILIALASLLTTAPLVRADVVSLNKPASANSTYPGLSPANAVDGNALTYWNAGNWASPQNRYWVQVDFLAEYPVDQIGLTFPSNPGYAGYTNIYNLYSSLDGSSWTLRGSGTLVDTLDVQHDYYFAPTVAARYVRYEVMGGTHWAGINEMSVYAVPEPAGIVGLSLAAPAIAYRRRSRIRH